MGKITLDSIRNAASNIGGKAKKQFNETADKVQDNTKKIEKKIHEKVESITSDSAATRWKLRYEVPFERWFYHYGLEKPIEDSKLQEARLWAIPAFFESALRATAAIVCALYSQIIGPKSEANIYLDMLNAQGQSLFLSFVAILSPNEAKDNAVGAKDKPLIGSRASQYPWGNLI